MVTSEGFDEAVRVRVNAGRLWAGGVATAIVAGLAVVVGVLIARGLLDIPVLAPGKDGSLGDSTTTQYAVLAAGSALLATALLHLLLVATPRPFSFFAWITGLAVVGTAIVPFTQNAALSSKVFTATMNVIVGIAVISLLSGVGRSATRPVPPGPAGPAMDGRLEDGY
jgi:hypothetical protein